MALSNTALICEVVTCQQHVAEATIKHLKMANSVFTKAKKYSSDNVEKVGLFFPPLKWPLKELTVADSSHATKETSYAQEGVMILLGHNCKMEAISSDSPHYRQVKDAEKTMSGYFHILAGVCHTAKRISSSTSIAETLSAVVGKGLGHLVAIRLTEIFSTGVQIPLRCENPLQTLIQI